MIRSIVNLKRLEYVKKWSRTNGFLLQIAKSYRVYSLLGFEYDTEEGEGRGWEGTEKTTKTTFQQRMFHWWNPWSSSTPELKQHQQQTKEECKWELRGRYTIQIIA